VSGINSGFLAGSLAGLSLVATATRAPTAMSQARCVAGVSDLVSGGQLL
jgi:hypothetical protein